MGDTLTMSASGDVIKGRQIVWSSADTTVASVSPDGRVAGKRVGTTTIVAAIKGEPTTASAAVVKVAEYAVVGP